MTTHWSEGVGWDLFLLSSSVSNLHFIYIWLYLFQTGFGLGRIALEPGSVLAAGQTLTGFSERINHAQAGGSYGSSPGCVQLRS